MNKLYEKNEVNFSLIMIAIYVVGMILAEVFSQMVGINKLFTAIFHLALSFIILKWIKENKLKEKYGLVKPAYPLKKAWYFLPLIIVASLGLIAGLKFSYSPLETMLFIISMVCVGFLEEIIFRGFLFLAIAKTNIKSAIIVSSLTFGLGHIVNLLNGAALFSTLMQIIFATAVGFSLVLLFYRGKSLLPCIAFHSLNNSLAVIEKSNAEVAQMVSMSESSLEFIVVMFFVVLLGIYSIFCLRKL